ncbi:phosphoadenosine phosphosulfate reductase domain-containing protein [Hamadaea tsunoensis]|uniref:phosphoadenosine phosphosulfate reductase domain-containing protein n=1 Tax=Hamadaea tsunoensis TaxID=53368 RepID=UPI0004029629|nr:phosphoadenosine phosphosulfate reductase family protein [Hamadaea tsunoensis]
MATLNLYELPPLAGLPDLTGYDWIIVNSSGGKDSQALLHAVYLAARAAGMLDRVVVLHCDLGEVEWQGTRHLARRQAAHYGFRFEVRKRLGAELLAYIRARHQQRWPRLGTRFCTASFKRDVGGRLITELVKELPKEQRRVRRPRVLYVMGIRGAESCGRAGMKPFEQHAKFTSPRREVDQWLPIHGWSEAQVWECIRAAGTPAHPIYSHGLTRASCSFCVLASGADLMRACQLRPDLAADYLDAEREMGDDFQHRRPLAVIAAQAAADPHPLTPIKTCLPCRGAGERPGQTTACPSCDGSGGLRSAYRLAA